ncbi:MAG: hypothetical protein ACHQNE_06260 [Candidatus Kapaibacterium sp.]
MNILKMVVLLVTGGAMLLGVELSEHVHSERWKVKTLADSFAVNTLAISTTIPEQAAIPEPNVGESVARLPSEKTLYTLDARLIEVKKEFDGDYHLVLEDPQTKLRMVAEIPDTTTPAPLADRKDYAEARATINHIAGRPGFFTHRLASPPMIEIAGIGFFDEPHMLTPDGMAPNGREIHPVLRVKPM